jgi:hypothetical protein
VGLSCSGLSEISVIPALPKLTHLICDSCDNLTDILAKSIYRLQCKKCSSLAKLPELASLTSLNCDGCSSLSRIPVLPNLSFLKYSQCPMLEQYTVPLKCYEFSETSKLCNEIIKKAIEYNPDNLEYLSNLLDKGQLPDRIVGIVIRCLLVKSVYNRLDKTVSNNDTNNT